MKEPLFVHFVETTAEAQRNLFFNDTEPIALCLKRGISRIAPGVYRIIDGNLCPAIPDIFVPDPRKTEVDPIALLNKEYETLSPEDRDEMDVWDCTLKDGLEDE